MSGIQEYLKDVDHRTRDTPRRSSFAKAGAGEQRPYGKLPGSNSVIGGRNAKNGAHYIRSVNESIPQGDCMSAKTTSVKKTANKSKTVKKSAKQIEVQEALQVTWLLKGTLKNAQLSYLRVGKLLSQVREKKMFVSLGHPDIEDYAEKRLQLGRASLYRYIQVYDWVTKNHPEWLQPKPKGFIPDLYDVAGLITIERELAEKNVSPQKRKKLEELQSKALTGELKSSEVAKVSKSSKTAGELMKNMALRLVSVRKQCSAISGIPAEVIKYLDGAIGLLNNEKAVAALKSVFADREMTA